MHPGWADTPGLAESLPGFYRAMRPVLRTPAEGVDTIVWLAADPAGAATSGPLYLDRRPRPFDRVPATRLSAADRRRLWDMVVALSGAPDPPREALIERRAAAAARDRRGGCVPGALPLP